MRMPIIALFVVAAALLGETQISNAQSPYSYPWCAIFPAPVVAQVVPCPVITPVGSNAGQQCWASAETASLAHITVRSRRSCRTIRW